MVVSIIQEFMAYKKLKSADIHYNSIVIRLITLRKFSGKATFCRRKIMKIFSYLLYCHRSGS